MGRFNPNPNEPGNDPGNGRGKQGKGDFDTTDQGDHILGTKDHDTGDDSPLNSITFTEVGVTDFSGLLAGLDGDDTLIDLQEGDDLFNGFAGNDRVYGDDGDDNLNGGDGDDVLVGGDGDDTIEGGAGADYIDGSAGNDTASYEDAPEDGPLVTDFGTFDGVAVSLETGRANNSDATGDELHNIENLVGSDFDDFLQGDAEANILMGGDGDDTIDGGAGADTIVGGNGLDDLTGGIGADTFVYNTAAEGGDTINDFNTTDPALGDGDLIDVSAALSGFGGTTLQDAVDGGFLEFVDDGNGDVLVRIDANGGSDGFVDLAALEGVGFTSEATAITDLGDNFLL